jgi:hypothetical protein
MPSPKHKGALAVDLGGLRQLVERRGKSFAILELLQNAWDEPSVTRVDITAESIGRGLVRVVVEDDAPEGFHDLSHAYTLYASSRKKANPEQRGRFNVGEKLVIALATGFMVETTTGGVQIDVAEDTRTVIRRKREAGSKISATLRMTQPELVEALATLHTVLPPVHITTTLNGDVLDRRTAIAHTTASLATEIADEHGFLRPTKRATTIEIYEPRAGETAALYEMGIPVVETGDRYHVNVLQKVPLNSDRDNVPPSFLRDVRALVLNAMAASLDGEQAAGVWVNDALEDDLIDPEAVTSVMAARFGAKRVTFDMNDLEANRSALAAGYTVVPSNTFSRDAWSKVRESGTTLPAGRLFASPKPMHADGTPLKTIDENDYTAEQARFARHVARLHRDLIGRDVAVILTNDRGWKFAGAYGTGMLGARIYLNVSCFDADITDADTLTTVLHEFGHAYGEHLTHAFDEGIAKVAAKLVALVIANDGRYFDE